MHALTSTISERFIYLYRYLDDEDDDREGVGVIIRRIAARGPRKVRLDRNESRVASNRISFLAISSSGVSSELALSEIIESVNVTMPGNRRLTKKTIKGKDNLHPSSRKGAPALNTVPRLRLMILVAGQLSRVYLRSAKLDHQAKIRRATSSTKRA